MRRLVALAGGGLLVCAAACSSSDGGGGGPTGAPDGGGPPATDAGSGADAPAPGSDGAAPNYSGGDVTVSLGDAEGGTVKLDAVSGKVTIHMVPAKPSAISKIEALVDGKVVGSASATPFDVVWDSASVANGAHSVTARPYDLAGLTGSSAPLSITTSNFMLAGTWRWSNVTDATPGFGADSCSDATFTVTFDPGTSTMTFPMFYLSCRAQNGATYSAKINGFTKMVMPSEYGGPITNTSGTVTTTFSTSMLTQTDSFNNDTQTGSLTKM